MIPLNSRAIFADLCTVLLLSIYGVQVCPLLEALAPWRVVTFILAAVGFSRLGANMVLARYQHTVNPGDRPRFVQRVAFGRSVAAGLLLGLFEMLAWGFPIGAGFKLLMGVMTLGLFIALDARFEDEARLMDEVERGQVHLDHMGSPTSRIREILSTGTFLLGLVALDLYFVVFKDFEELTFVSEGNIERAAMVVGGEFAAVAAVLLGGVVHLMQQAARNLRRMFDAQTWVLRQISEGRLEVYVPVASDDEFGVIASYTNQMIDALRERERLRETLGKVVDPAVARRLMADGLHMAGRRQELVVLFADVRGFTSWTEQSEPEVVVRDLNRYFSAMVEVIHRNGGIVDKFIGDGLMAVFGLELGVSGQPMDSGKQAVTAAREMLSALETLNVQLERPLRIGVGVHRGEVVAGIIGAPERLEYTCVGDAVNTAARVETLTRALGVDLLITAPVRESLAEAGDWRSMGVHALKGKSQALEVFSPL